MDFTNFLISEVQGSSQIDLEKVKEPKVIPWTQWWENVVFATNGGLIDRKLTMLSLANQDGGVHAEAYNSLPESYRIFSEGMWMRDGKTNSRQRKPLLEIYPQVHVGTLLCALQL